MRNVKRRSRKAVISRLCLWQVCIDADLPRWLTREEGKAKRHLQKVDAVQLYDVESVELLTRQLPSGGNGATALEQMTNQFSDVESDILPGCQSDDDDD